MLLADKIGAERQWSEFLRRGCTQELSKSLDIADNANMKLLKDFLVRGLDVDSERYIDRLNPGLIAEARTFRSRFEDIQPAIACSR